jgi:uncharacterized secreted protein with C-terminal beta-propeller domain
MDEHNGYLRVATTDHNANHIRILDPTMKQVGAVEDLAPGERIYSARFMGDRGYIVTFVEIDPLFSFDLSDPYNPVLLGELKIPGYSTYLHPYDENHLIGFGEDTILSQWGGALSAGLKMTMFDVTDPTNMLEKFYEFIGDRGSNSPLLTDHKAILQDTARDIFAFPATEHRLSRRDRLNEWAWGEFYRQGAFVYSIDMAGESFNLRGVLSHRDLEGPQARYWHGGAWTSSHDVERIIYIGDYFYTFSRTAARSWTINDLKLTDTVFFR